MAAGRSTPVRRLSLADPVKVVGPQPKFPRRKVRAQVYERRTKAGKPTGTFDFRFKAPNGAKVAGSLGQGYTSRRDAHRALRAFLASLSIAGGGYVIEDVD